MSKASMETAIRNRYLAMIIDFFDKQENSDCLPVSASELAIPVVDDEGNEKFVLIKVSVPRGTRNGDGTYTPYNGYDAHEDWQMVLDDRAGKAAARKEKADRKEKERTRKREAKQVIKKLNTVGFKALVAQPPEDEGE